MDHQRPAPRVVALTLRAGALAVAVVLGATAARGDDSQECLATRNQIERWMQLESAKGYDLLKTANAVRLQAAVILGLVRSSGPAPRRLWMTHERYFDAYIDVAGIAAESAPAFALAARDNREDVVLDYRTGVVVAAVEKGSRPDLAVNVLAGWQGAAESYTYEDRTASPPLRVTHERVNSFRLLVYDDVIVYDAIEGITGRATGGALGAVFRVIGDGKAVRARFVVAPDGVQITRTTAKKGPIEITPTATVYPDGRGERGLPRHRDDLRALEGRLRTPLQLRYVPLDTTTMPDLATQDCS